MKKSVKVMAAAMAAMMTLAGCGSKTAETTAADTTAAEITAEAAAEETTAEGVKIADGEYTIGIGQFAEHGSLDNCRTGFLQGLADEGIVEGKNLTILYENAQADGGTASQIMNNFLSKKAWNSRSAMKCWLREERNGSRESRRSLPAIWPAMQPWLHPETAAQSWKSRRPNK